MFLFQFREYTVASSALTAPLAIVLIASLIAAVTDIWKFRVYNLLTFPLLLTGLAYHAWHGELGSSLLGALFGFGALIVLHVLGGVGAGDVKLMAGVGAWLGAECTFIVFIASSLAAGVYASALVLLTGQWVETVTNLRILMLRLGNLGRYLGSDERMEIEVNRDDRRRRVIPFGAMVAIGVVATLFLLWNK
jgi:prepilin peptidase CpaA